MATRKSLKDSSKLKKSSLWNEEVKDEELTSQLKHSGIISLTIIHHWQVAQIKNLAFLPCRDN